MTKKFILNMLSAGIALAMIPAGSRGQLFDETEPTSDWQVSFVAGFLTGDTFLTTRNKVDNAPVGVTNDAGLLTGIRLGAEQEYLGWEITTAVSFSDLEVNAHPLAAIPSGRDLTTFLGDINALVYPTGYTWSEGRVRPYITAGGGIAHFDSNFDLIGAETALDVNAGAGVKFLMGDTGKYFLRLDWRWHYFTGGGDGMENTIYRQELTFGVGFRF